MNGGPEYAHDSLTERESEILACLVEGLSNHEIADRLHLAHRTVKWYNSQIYSKLGVSSREEAVEQAQALGLLPKSALDEAQPVVRHNLPTQTTPFIGRQRELTDLTKLLADPGVRLLTILAPGGMGKTRLALAAAEGQLRRFADGVFFVPLAPLSSPDDIVTAIAEHVGFSFYGGDPPVQQLLDYFRERNALLVLDNFEHLLDGAPLVTDLVQTAPAVRVLATSREKLNLRGETVFTLSGLHFPDWETPEDALDYDAVQLFMQSAHLARPDFELQADELDFLARICRLTAGMPLGIVLAAGWLDTLSLERIADEIKRGIDILETEQRDVPERQRSVRATFNYSWGRLTESEQRVFMMLSVFRGGFTPDAAQAVAGANVRALRRLVGKALVGALPDGRYDIHELLRQYAEERLIAAGESDALYEVHARYYADFMRQRALDVKGRRQLEGLNEIEADWNNVRGAWEWALAHRDWDVVGQMKEALHLFCDMRARYSEGDALFQQALEALAPQTGEEPNRLWGELLVRTAVMLTLPETDELLGRINDLLDLAEQQAGMGDDPLYLWARGKAVNVRGLDEDALPLLEASLSGFRERDDRYYMAKVLRWMTFVCLRVGGQFAEQGAHYNHQYLELTREIGDETGMAHGLYYNGFPFWSAGQFDEVEPFLRQARDIWQQYGDRKSVGAVTINLGQIAYERGEFERARSLLSEAVQTLADVNYPHRKVHAQRILGEIACIEGDYTTGQQMLADLSLNGYDLPSFGLLIAAVGQGDFQLAREHLRVCLRQFTSLPTQLRTVTLFPIIAILLAHEGRPERAVELLALRVHVRQGVTDRFSNWTLLEQVRGGLEAELGAELYADAWERGTQHDLDTTIDELLGEFGGES